MAGVARSRRMGFAALALALALLAVEGIALVLHAWRFGAFTYADADALRALAVQAPGTQPPEQAPRDARALADESDRQALHPYVGYVLDPSANPILVNGWGFLGRPMPLAGDRDADEVSVVLLGGSVAEQVGSVAGDALSQELERIPEFAGRPVRVHSLALRGLKQPQQLLALTWMLSLGARVDVVINLDGYNEMVLAEENARQGVYPFYPRRWKTRLEGISDPALVELAGRARFFESVRSGLAARLDASILRASVSVGLGWRLLDERLSREIDEAQAELGHRLLEAGPDDQASWASTGPLFPGGSPKKRRARLATYWRDCSILLDRLSRSRGIRYFHFLQPNQWVEDSKPMGPEEREVALSYQHYWGREARSAYPYLIAHGRALTQAGVAFADLTMLFESEEAPRYVDSCCHLNTEGTRELATAMGEAVRRAYEQSPRRTRGSADASQAPSRSERARLGATRR